MRPRVPRSISVEGPISARHGVMFYRAHCRIPQGEGRGYRNGTLMFRVMPGSRIANLLARRIPGLNAVCFGDRVHVPSSVRISNRLLEHEAMHVWQYLVRCRGSMLRYLVGYLYHLVRRGYLAHPWEIEARSIHGNTYNRSLA